MTTNVNKSKTHHTIEHHHHSNDRYKTQKNSSVTLHLHILNIKLFTYEITVGTNKLTVLWIRSDHIFLRIQIRL
jgi:hypothetical protein